VLTTIGVALQALSQINVIKATKVESRLNTHAKIQAYKQDCAITHNDFI
jgi:hypothetical protein